MAKFLYLSNGVTAGFFGLNQIDVNELIISDKFKKFLLEIMGTNTVFIKDSGKFSNKDIIGHDFKFCLINEISVSSSNSINYDCFEEIKKMDDLQDILDHYYPDIKRSDYNKLSKIVCYKDSYREHELYSDYYSDRLCFYTDLYKVFKYLEYVNKLNYLPNEFKEDVETKSNVDKIFNHINYDYNVSDEVNERINKNSYKIK